MIMPVDKNLQQPDIAPYQTPNFHSYQYIMAMLYDHPHIWQNWSFLQRVDTFLMSTFQEVKNNPSNIPFRGSFFEVYHMARNQVTITTASHPERFVAPSTFQQIDQTPFFTPGRAQFDWREMYNTLCDSMTTTRWTTPDTAPFPETSTPWDLQL
jgi:hypothetical protein